jgi:hypothetical protein
MGQTRGMFDRQALVELQPNRFASVYERLRYTNIKTQYSFVKSLAGTSQDLRRFVPRVELSSR